MINTTPYTEKFFTFSAKAETVSNRQTADGQKTLLSLYDIKEASEIEDLPCLFFGVHNQHKVGTAKRQFLRLLDYIYRLNPKNYAIFEAAYHRIFELTEGEFFKQIAGNNLDVMESSGKNSFDIKQAIEKNISIIEARKDSFDPAIGTAIADMTQCIPRVLADLQKVVERITNDQSIAGAVFNKKQMTLQAFSDQLAFNDTFEISIFSLVLKLFRIDVRVQMHRSSAIYNLIAPSFGITHKLFDASQYTKNANLRYQPYQESLIQEAKQCLSGYSITDLLDAIKEQHPLPELTALDTQVTASRKIHEVIGLSEKWKKDQAIIENFFLGLEGNAFTELLTNDHHDRYHYYMPLFKLRGLKQIDKNSLSETMHSLLFFTMRLYKKLIRTLTKTRWVIIIFTKTEIKKTGLFFMMRI